MGGKQWSERFRGRSAVPRGAPTLSPAPSFCPPAAHHGQLTSAAGPLPAALLPPPCGSRRSRWLAHRPRHSPGARPEAAPGQDRGHGWCWPRQHLPQAGQGSPSQSAPGSAACWPRGPSPAPLPPVPSHSGYPSLWWVKEPVALPDGDVCSDPQDFQPQGWALGSGLQSLGLRSGSLVNRGPAGPCGALGPLAAACQSQDWEDRLSGTLSMCPFVHLSRRLLVPLQPVPAVEVASLRKFVLSCWGGWQGWLLRGMIRT